MQQASIPVVLAGTNAVILAPTAGGKTEAAFLPALELLHRERKPGVRLLYVSPLIALLNNQEARVERLAGLLGMHAFKWHGGVNASARQAFRDEPAEVLLTTPESLEAMFIHGQPVRTLFAHLRLTIIDEVHSFSDNDRGAQLISLIERLAQVSSEDIQRIGLSATVANPAEIGRWMRGSSRRPGQVVRAGGGAPKRQAVVIGPGQPEVMTDLRRRTQAGKTLAFTESRADAEMLADQLHRTAKLDFIGTYHSAISRDARQHAEDAMSGNSYPRACLTCTSAMELGVDIGDLDDVLQWGAPGSVSSLLQRWGRSGRRAGWPQHTTLYPQSDRELLTVAAQLSLAQDGWVESVRPRRRAYHILLQQMLSEVLSARGHTPVTLWKALSPSPAFSQIPEAEYRRLLAHLLTNDILAQAGGQLALGDRGEAVFGRRHLSDLIATFESPSSYTLVNRADRFEVGQIELNFVEELRTELEAGQRPVLLLGARAWQVQALQDRSAVVLVQPDTSGRPPKWAGGLPRQMERALAWRHRELLLGHPHPDGLDAAARQLLEEMQSQHTWLAGSLLPVQWRGNTLTLHTYAGTRINTTLQAALKPFGAVQSDAYVVTLRGNEPTSLMGALDLLYGNWSASEDQQAILQRLRVPRLSKYQAHLPADLARQVTLDALADWSGMLEVVKTLPPRSTVLPLQ
ncbi:DEAD/DEAH box helicase [Deinococcus psychrotolerans]|uniref:DEAD/DEAH box helicase n=1 Tax=Deinococcus psychrotolerans TaxID=2489213 RepID=UPI0013DDEB8E|nr:DEAD/DEAH box helicase [Deinococcus psychrotolerans]